MRCLVRKIPVVTLFFRQRTLSFQKKKQYLQYMSSAQKNRSRAYTKRPPSIRSRVRRATFLLGIAVLAVWIIFRLATGTLTIHDIGTIINDMTGIRINTGQQQAPGEVVVLSVPDGDTLEVRQSNGKVDRLRLYGVDAPELKQHGGKEARAFAESLLYAGSVSPDVRERDQYGRSIAVLHLADGRIVNEEMVRAGHAWVYRNYCRESFCNQWISLEKQAKSQNLGVWRQNNPTPPWKWRKDNPRQ